MSKVLFVYPNKEAYPIIPLGISVLSGILKNSGHEVDLFDITFMIEQGYLDLHAREQLNIVEKVDVYKYWGNSGEMDIDKELVRKIRDFKPDIIGFSIVENNYSCARHLFSVIKAKYDVSIIVGGVFPTVAPQFFIDDQNVDMICIGEGEKAMKELADRIDKKEGLWHIPNLIVKSEGKVITNKPGKFYDWEPLIFQDWDIFDERHLMKPFMGKMWKTGFFELSRGCPYSCTYCIDHFYQKKFKECGRYRREKPIDYAIKEIAYMKEKDSLELVWFHDENFCMMSGERLDEFCTEYKRKIGLSFFIQTSADTLLDEKKVEMLKDAGCITISIGVEVGNEQIRTKTLNKHIKNEVYVRAFDNCQKYKIRTTANVMIGLPMETEENIMETISFCRECNADSIGIAIFAPYYGTKLRDECVEKGLMEDKYYENISFNYKSILKMPQISTEKFEYLYYNFHNLVYGGNRYD